VNVNVDVNVSGSFSAGQLPSTFTFTSGIGAFPVLGAEL
jgi:hypothetical protein